MKFRLIIDKTKEEQVVVIAHEASPFTERLKELVTGGDITDALAVYAEDEKRLLPYAQIECITVSDGKTWVIDHRGKRYRVKLRLYEVEKRMPENYIRINKSAIANENRLDRFAVGFSGAVDAVFKSGYREYVSRRCFAQIKRRFEQK